MANKSKREVNAGIHASTGFEFQKHCAIFLFLEKYPAIKDTHYFIILEHHEDIIFGYLDKNSKLEKIEAFQAKKSSAEWKVSHLYEIVKKILANGLLLRKDEIEKGKGYSQDQFFATNHSIKLKIKEKKVWYGSLVNETNSEIRFSNVDKQVRDDIIAKLKTKFSYTSKELDELDNLFFKYIDLSKKNASQLQQLEGMFRTVFGSSITDHNAALNTLLFYFRTSEVTFNQGDIAKLTDPKKRIESSQINDVLQILTTKKKAYDLWRDRSRDISLAMKISIPEQKHFQLHYENSFDKFKDLKETEHQKIYKHVLKEKRAFSKYYDDESCLEFLNNSYKNNNNTQLSDLQIKAALYAAYMEINQTS